MNDSVSSNDQTLSVGQVYRRSKNALAREFRGEIWVSGEIKNLRDVRGSLYLTLIEPGDYNDGGDTSVDVACRPKIRSLVLAQLGQAGITLAAGMQVRVRGVVTLSKFAKLQLDMSALDTEALIGRQATERRRLYEKLVAEGIFDANRKLQLALVPLRVGLVTSHGSEGQRDFLGQLERSGYAFQVTFAHSPVQGPTAPASLARAVGDLCDDALDVIVLVRGGGGELDAYDKEAVVRAIATCPLPVFTGIGHTGDRAVADDVAHSSFITPTECGQALVRSVREFLDGVSAQVRRLDRLSDRALQNESARLAAHRRHLTRATTLGIERCANSVHRQAERAHRCADRDLALAVAMLDSRRRTLPRATVAAIGRNEARLQTWRAQVRSLDPRLQLQRGFSLTRTSEGKLIRSAADLEEGEVIVTQLAHGSASSTVIDISKDGD